MHRDHPQARLLASAAANDGLATVPMALSCGLTESTFRRLVRRQQWRQPQAGVWLLPGVPLDWWVHLSAAMQRVGGAVAATGAAALRLHGIDRGVPAPPILLATPLARNIRSVRPPVRVTRCELLRLDDIAVLQDVPVVPVAWGLAHLGTQATERQVLVALTAARQREVVTLGEVDEVLDRAAGMPGVGVLRRVRHRFEVEQPDSGLEWDARALFRRGGFEPDAAPFPFWLPAAGPVVHFDIPFSWAWAAWEGEDFHTHGRSQRTFDLDRERHRRARKAGWDLRVITRSRLRDDPRGVLEEVAEVLGGADPWRPPPPATRCRRPRCPVCLDRFGQ